MRKILNRVIAFCLTFILLLAPLLSYGGGKGSTKAQEGGTTYQYAYTVTGITSVMQDGSGKYHVSATNKTEHWYVAEGDSVNLEVKWDNKGTLTEEVTNVEYSKVNVVYQLDSEDSPLQSEIISGTPLVDGKTIAIQGGQKVGIYMQPEISGINVTDIYYTLVATVEVGVIKADMLPDIRWVDSAGSEIGTTYVKDGVKLAATGGTMNSVSVIDGNGAKNTYDIVYGYAEGEVSIEKVTAWQTDISKINVKALDENVKERKCRAFVAYAKKNADGAYIRLVDGNIAEISQTSDRISPDFSGATLELQKSTDFGVTWNKVDDYSGADEYYADIATKPQYRFVLKGLSDGTGVGVDESKVKISLGSDSNMTWDASGSAYCTEVIILPKSLTDIKIQATDKAGNQSEKSFGKIMAVDKTFRAVSCKITSDSSGKNEVDLPLGYTNIKYYLMIEAVSGYGFETVKATYVDDETNTCELYNMNVDNIVREEGLYHVKQAIQLPPELILPGANGSIVFNNIQVTIKDKKGKAYASSVGTFQFDNVDPVVSDVKLLENTNGLGMWNQIGLGEVGSCYVDVESASEYRYSFNVEDGGSGIQSVKCYTDESCLDRDLYREGIDVIEQEGTSSTWYCNVTKSDIPEDGAPLFELWIQVTDGAGNTTKQKLTPILKKIRKNIDFGQIWLENESGEQISWKELEENLDVNTSQSHTLYVQVSSGYAIGGSSIGIRESADEDDTDETIVGVIQNGTNTQNLNTRRYEATLIFNLPNNPNFNEKYSDMTVYVEDTRACTCTEKHECGKVAEKTLWQLIYDNTIPVLDIKRDKIPSIWVNAYTLEYGILPGTQSIETDLAEARYKIDSGEWIRLEIGDDGKIKENLLALKIPESKTISGTKVTFYAEDAAGNALPDKDNSVVVHVDNTSPQVGSPMIEGADAKVPMSGAPVIKADIKDNLSLDKAWMTIEYPDGRRRTKSVSYDTTGNDITRYIDYTLEADSEGKAADGAYTVTVCAIDKAGNKTKGKALEFRVDNTKPVVGAEIVSGMAGGKALRPDGTDMYYNSDVGVQLSCRDENIEAIYVTDNGQDVNSSVEWSGGIGALALSGEGRHVVKIYACDRAGNVSEERQVEFIIDKSVPVLSLSLNGMPYTEDQGMLYLGGDAAVGVTVADMTVDVNDLNYQVVQTRPDMPTTTSMYLRTAANSMTFYEEAEYALNFFAVDMASNQGATRTVRFRIDRTAPELGISGVAGSGTSSDAATVRCSMREAFWQDARGTVTIYRRAGDGFSETLYKTIDITPTAYETIVSETLTETGEYRIEFEASDRTGHRTTTSRTFMLDREAPSITLTGVKNYDVTDKTIEFHSEIGDEFYSSKTVTIEGTRTDINGKVSTISFAGFNQRGNPTIIDETFSEDGIYDITVSATDAAGNVRTSSVHFTIDKTKPQIGSLEQYDGTVLTAFHWDTALDELVSDLTVCDVHMYLNGSEYDGVSKIDDGSYTLLITAEDELGHYSEASVSFILDTKAPVFIVTGVEDGEAKEEAYSIDISLQLEEDMLTLVTLNDKIVTISNNTAHIDVEEEGSYTLYMKASDAAGNEAEKTIQFRFGAEVNMLLWIIIICAVLAVGIILFIVLKRKRDRE